MDKRYQPEKVETRIYKMWEGGGYFTPKVSSVKCPPAGEAGQVSSIKPFCIIMPPPNANDPLHMGHALFVTLEDLMIRYHRMKGDITLWLPGADHAGIETQYVFEKKLREQGKSRFDFTREEFYQMVWDYVQKNIGTMKVQFKSLGASCDWARFKYTLDPDIIRIVYQTFYQLLQDGLAYRDERIINFCTQCGTAFSDLEVKYQERTDPLYYLKYGPFTLATVRPETKFGDTAVAVHPKDKRYKKWVGEEIVADHIIGKVKLKVIADEAVDPKFGTGVIKVTPAHDSTDFEIGQRHNLERKRVIGFDGKLTALTGKYAGTTSVKARKKVAEDLKKKGLLVKVDKNYKHTVGACYRCATIIEPMILPQWFIKISQKLKVPAPEQVRCGAGASQKFGEKKLSLKEMGIFVVKKNLIKIIPKKYEKQYLHWMENLRDWNISRQIWWGIRIPVWYCANCHKIKKYGQITWIPREAKPILRNNPPKGTTLGRVVPFTCPHCHGKNLIQDPDTFDTWFSSAQWPFATLLTSCGSISNIKYQKANIQIKNQKDSKQNNNITIKQYNNKTMSDFELFYPTSVMETAYDILYFWVARMIMMGIYKTGKVPFKTVYLHGLLRDVKRVKMSKSKGNVINPLEMTKKYGTDALRMALIVGSSPGNDVILWEKKIEGYRNFANKIWNIGRFIKIQEVEPASKSERSELFSPAKRDQVQPLNKEDKIILKDLNRLIKNTTHNLETFRFSQAAEELYHFIWHRLADEYLEYAKGKLRITTPNQSKLGSGQDYELRITKKNQGEAEQVMTVLNHVYLTCLQLLHPFMPFLTEELWGIFGQKKPLIISKWSVK